MISNPDNLSLKHLGAGWRFLDTEEICDAKATLSIQVWDSAFKKWARGACGCFTHLTYRTKLSVVELAIERGLVAPITSEYELWHPGSIQVKSHYKSLKELKTVNKRLQYMLLRKELINET